MAGQKKESVVHLIHCKDWKGIVARVTEFIYDFGGKILVCLQKAVKCKT